MARSHDRADNVHVPQSVASPPKRSQTLTSRRSPKARSDEAISRGVFGSRWFFVDGELFWGWDRLPMIDDWLTRGG